LADILKTLRILNKGRAAGKYQSYNRKEMILANENLGMEWFTVLYNLIVAEGKGRSLVTESIYSI